ncbi:hypothetical protein DSD29_10135 [Weissella confusa]|nr:hypothetical protein [Weissella confusa]
MINEINLLLDRFQRNTVSGFRRKNYIFGEMVQGKVPLQILFSHWKANEFLYLKVKKELSVREKA